MYRIAVLTDLKHEGEHYAKVINDYCINQKLFPLLETYQNQEVFFKEIQTHVPDIVLLVLPGVDGLNAAEHLRSLFPGCGIIWCSNLDFIPCNDSINDHYDIWRQPDCRICR